MASGKINSTTPSTEEYLDTGTRYETLLLQQRKLYDLFLSRTDDKNNNRTNVKQPSSASASAKVGTAAILSNHAAMSGMLQSATYSLKQRERCKKTDDEIEDLTALWEYTLRQQNYDHDLHITQRDERRIPFGMLCSMAALEDCDHLDEASLPNGTGLDSVTCGSEDVDGFFEDYPECVRRDTLWEHLDDYNDEQDDEQSCDTDKFQAAGLKPPSELVGVGLEVDGKSIQRQSKSQSIAPSFEQVKNPYTTRANNPYTTRADKVANGTFRPHNQRASSSRPESSWDTYTPKHAQGDSGMNEIPVNSNNYSNNSPGSLVTGYTNLQDNGKKNPFCTAREFKYQNNDGTDVNEDTLDFTDEERRFDKNSQGYNSTGGIHTTASAPPALSHNPNRPSLSAGLKRKFQLPRPRNDAINSSNNASSKGEAGQKPRQSSKETEEDDPLPEELKGLDKELIAKIENEIVDSGDPITFQDIAGLEDAKQAVLELVCWPMKRPDLFTGLRRGPNGLLLFGPPGTGKTLIGKAIAHESGATFFSISSSSLTSKWIGEGEKLVRTLFAVAAYREPAVVFIDEIDSLLTQRKADENEASRRIKTEFLVQLGELLGGI